MASPQPPIVVLNSVIDTTGTMLTTEIVEKISVPWTPAAGITEEYGIWGAVWDAANAAIRIVPV